MTVTNYFPRKEDLVFHRAEAVIRHLVDVIAARAPGESMLAAIRRDYAEAAARADVTLGISSPAFVRMILSSPALIGRVREMLDQREQALGDAIAAETGPTARSSALWRPSSPRSTACCPPRPAGAAWPASHAKRSPPCWPMPPPAFDLLEPSLGSYGIRAKTG